MSRYIDADLILYKTVAYPVFDFATGMVHTELLEGEYAKREKIEAVPTADVQEVRRGKWELSGKNVSKCTKCGCARDIRTQVGWNFCPVCGAKMGEEENV